MNRNFNSNATPIAGINSRDCYTYNTQIPIRATVRHMVGLQHEMKDKENKYYPIIAINPNRKGVKI